MENVEPAGFWIRAAGQLIDYVPTYAAQVVSGGVLAIVAGFVAASAGKTHSVVLDSMVKTSAITYIGAFLATTLYHAFCKSAGGATLGKRLLGLEVVSEELQPATFLQGLKRALGFFVDALFFGLIAYNVMESSDTRQRLGDQWAKTRVVLRRSLPPEARRPTRIFVFVFLGAMGIIVETVVLAHICSYWLLA